LHYHSQIVWIWFQKELSILFIIDCYNLFYFVILKQIQI